VRNPRVAEAVDTLRVQLRQGRGFRRLAGRHHRGLAVAGFPLDDQHLKETLDQLISQGHCYKHDQTSTVASARFDDQDWVIKRYNHQGLIHGLRRCFTTSRARKSFVLGLLLDRLGIATPKPLAYIETRSGPLPGDGYIVCEKSPGETLHHLLMTGQLDRALWPAVVAQTRELVAALHHLGITHGDVKHTNLLLGGDRLEIIDLDSLRIHRRLRRFERDRRKDASAVDNRVGGDPAAYIARKKVELGLI